MLLGAQIFHSPWLTHRPKWLQSQQSGEFLFFPPGSILKIDWYIEIKEALWGLKKKGCNQSSQIHLSVIIFSFQALLIDCCRACWPHVLLPTWFLIFDREETTVSKVSVLKLFGTCHINLFSIWKLSLLFHCILFNVLLRNREPCLECLWQMIALWYMLILTSCSLVPVCKICTWTQHHVFCSWGESYWLWRK